MQCGKITVPAEEKAEDEAPVVIVPTEPPAVAEAAPVVEPSAPQQLGASPTAPKETGFVFGSAPKQPLAEILMSETIAWGATASATIGAFYAAIEDRKRREKAAAIRKREERLIRLGLKEPKLSYAERVKQYKRIKEQEARNRWREAQAAAWWPKWTAQQAAQVDPYAGIGEWHERQDNANAAVIAEFKEKERRANTQAAVDEIEAEKVIGYIDPEVEEARKLKAIEDQKNAELDSATLNYIAMENAVANGEFSKEEYDETRKLETEPGPMCYPETEEKTNLTGSVLRWGGENLRDIFKNYNDVNNLRPLQFRKRSDGFFSVGVNQDLALTNSSAYLDEIAEGSFEFASGGKYAASTLFGRTSRGILRASVPQGADFLSPFLFNGYDYMIGDKQGETDKVQKWALSSGVDIASTIVSGLVAAGFVLLVAGAITLLASSAVISAPILLGAAVITGLVLEIGIEISGVKDPINDWVNEQWDTKVEPGIGDFFKKANNVLNLPAPTPAQPPIPNPTPQPPSPVNSTSTPEPTEANK